MSTEKRNNRVSQLVPWRAERIVLRGLAVGMFATGLASALAVRTGGRSDDSG